MSRTPSVLPTLMPPPKQPLPEAQFKAIPEDFVVDEVPLYEPCGTGDHLYIYFEKKLLNTMDVVKLLAKHFGTNHRTAGWAGLKDMKSISRQWVSLEKPLEAEARLKAFQHPQLTLLKAVPHKNKIKIGHLRGNRFRIKLRVADATRVNELATRCNDTFELLVRRGLPNFYGDQRYGRSGNNAELGKYLVQGNKEAFARVQGDQHIEMRMARLLVNAFQSDLFNIILARRMPDIDKLYQGDIVKFHTNKTCFTVLTEEDAIKEQPRCTRFEITPTGPIFGPKSPLAYAGPGEVEREVLREAGVTLEMFGSDDAKNQVGARRHLRVPFLEAPTVSSEENAVNLSFALPSGSYATTVVREIFGMVPESFVAIKHESR